MVTMAQSQSIEASATSDTLDYDLWMASKAVETCRNALNEAYAARLDLDGRHSFLLKTECRNREEQIRSLQHEVTRERQGRQRAEKKIEMFTGRLDEEIIRNELLSFQLDQTQSEVSERKDAANVLTEKLEQATSTVEDLKTELAKKVCQILELTQNLTDRDYMIIRLEESYYLLKGELGKNGEGDSGVIRLKAVLSNQASIINEIHEQLHLLQQLRAREKAAFILARQAASTEIARLGASCHEHETELKKIREENLSLQGDVDALIDMSIESDAIGGAFTEENKRLNDHVSTLKGELEAVRKTLENRFPGLYSDLSNLSDILNA